MKMIPCAECGKPRRDINKLPLCQACQNDRKLRVKYGGKVQDKKVKVEPPPWPKKSEYPTYCRHGLKDGLCAPCERAQRALAGIV